MIVQQSWHKCAWPTTPTLLNPCFLHVFRLYVSFLDSRGMFSEIGTDRRTGSLFRDGVQARQQYQHVNQSVRLPPGLVFSPLTCPRVWLQPSRLLVVRRHITKTVDGIPLEHFCVRRQASLGGERGRQQKKSPLRLRLLKDKVT